ncbi:MAG TPA: TIGR04283 family arsenosugar biosynthesis glycosyltransferase [Leptolyngbyaceae cyanobacterium M65_K2018_010]|nr:TIGR04283 family arsenosugar biosynthesis glycosyltransferase [Leptolyngbyaceae cyanobacterium M65_K2018_010]
MDVSIIIPTWNEARCLGRTLRGLRGLDPAPEEIWLVDGGSTDETVAIAQSLAQQLSLPLTVVSSQVPGRAIQMNLGAARASGDILCFLHADTLVPDDLITLMQTTLADRGTACGGFISLMAGPRTTRWGVTLHNTLKTYYAPLLFRPHLFFGQGLRLLFGDQVMFCRRSDFEACGGYDAELPIMEEADLCLKLCRFGRIRQINRVVQCSDRRVAALGPLKAHLIYILVGLLWSLGVPAPIVKGFYEEIR